MKKLILISAVLVVASVFYYVSQPPAVVVNSEPNYAIELCQLYAYATSPILPEQKTDVHAMIADYYSRVSLSPLVNKDKVLLIVNDIESAWRERTQYVNKHRAYSDINTFDSTLGSAKTKQALFLNSNIKRWDERRGQLQRAISAKIEAL